MTTFIFVINSRVQNYGAPNVYFALGRIVNRILPHKKFTKSNLTYQIFQMAINK